MSRILPYFSFLYVGHDGKYVYAICMHIFVKNSDWDRMYRLLALKKLRLQLIQVYLTLVRLGYLYHELFCQILVAHKLFLTLYICGF